MPRHALVVLGAGASYDLLDANGAALPPPGVNADYEPPLTEGLFSTRPTFQGILQNYPDASTLAETIRVKPKEVSLEQFLRTIKESPAEHLQRQFKEVPLYLQELFGAVSQNYLISYGVKRQPANYAHLVGELLCHFDRVAFVTLNYDLFLEQVLAIPSLAGTEANTMDWYIQERWLLVKLHGSVNWGRRIIEYPDKFHNVSRLEAIGETVIDGNLDEEIAILPSYNARWINQVPYYPAIAVPLEDKYGFSCPASHVDELAMFLPTCSDVLIVGISGKDADLLHLLQASLPDVINFMLVDKKDRNGRVDARDRLLKTVKKLRTPLTEVFDGGFTKFVQGGGVSRFASVLRP